MLDSDINDAIFFKGKLFAGGINSHTLFLPKTVNYCSQQTKPSKIIYNLLDGIKAWKDFDCIKRLKVIFFS